MNKDSLHATHRASITFIIDTSSWLQVHHQPIHHYQIYKHMHSRFNTTVFKRTYKGALSSKIGYG
jgi:hypothetical protein